MHIRNYEIPAGRSNGQPEVLVAQPVISEIGMPEVDYDSLHKFMTDDLGVPYKDKTVIKLYGRTENSGLLGFHIPYSRTVHINAPSSENTFASTGGVMRVLAHEGRHRSDSRNRRFVTTAEMISRWASYSGVYKAALLMPLVPRVAVMPAAIVAAATSRRIYYRHLAPEEKRARKQEGHESTKRHQRDIVFPNSWRTRLFELDNSEDVDRPEPFED